MVLNTFDPRLYAVKFMPNIEPVLLVCAFMSTDVGIQKV